MNSKTRFRAAVTTLVTAALVLLSLPIATPAQAAYSNGKCADNTGLNVVVDYQDGRAPEVRCVKDWQGGTGLAGFQAAGFQLTGVGGSLDFVCKINGVPASELCDEYPKSGFWSYWTSASGSWQFSNRGITETTLQSGNWQGFSFSSVNSSHSNPKPGVTPTVPPAPKPDPTPSKTSSPKPKPSKTSKPKPSKSPTSKPSDSATSEPKPSSSAQPETSATATPKPSESAAESETSTPDDEEVSDDTSAAAGEDGEDAPTLEATDSPTESATEPSEVEKQDQLANQRATQSESGPPVGTLIAIGIIALIAAAAVIRQRLTHRAREEN